MSTCHSTVAQIRSSGTVLYCIEYTCTWGHWWHLICDEMGQVAAASDSRCLFCLLPGEWRPPHSVTRACSVLGRKNPRRPRGMGSFDWSASAGGSAVHTDRTPTVGPSPVYNFLKRTISMRAGALRQSRGAKWNIASPVGEFCTGHHRQRAAAADCAGKKTRRKKTRRSGACRNSTRCRCSCRYGQLLRPTPCRTYCSTTNHSLACCRRSNRPSPSV